MNATSIHRPFANRREAGRKLAATLTDFKDVGDLVILALPRGGVPVAAEIATAFDKPFDLLIVRKIGVSGYDDFSQTSDEEVHSLITAISPISESNKPNPQSP